MNDVIPEDGAYQCFCKNELSGTSQGGKRRRKDRQDIDPDKVYTLNYKDENGNMVTETDKICKYYYTQVSTFSIGAVI